MPNSEKPDQNNNDSTQLIEDKDQNGAKHGDKYWRETLTPIQFAVTRQSATEAPFSGEYWDHWNQGQYLCLCCGTPLFTSDTKFNAGCGWPSYFNPVNQNVIAEYQDRSHGRQRTEVRCKKCDAHLGHVFNDSPAPSGLRYCINSAAIKFK